MAVEDLKISELDPVVNPNPATDLFAVVSDGVTKKTPIDQFIIDYLVGAPNIGSDSDWLGPGQVDNTLGIYHLGSASIGVLNTSTYLLDVQNSAYTILSNFINSKTGTGRDVAINAFTSGISGQPAERIGIIGDADDGSAYNIGVVGGNFTDPDSLLQTSAGVLATYTTGVYDDNFALYVGGEGNSTSNLYGIYIKSGNVGAGEGFGFWMEDGNESAGFVLTCDANGKGIWAAIPTVTPGDDDWGFVSGSTDLDPIFHRGNVNIGVNSDDGVLLRVVSDSSTQFPFRLKATYDEGFDVTGVFSETIGVNAALNQGGRFIGRSSTTVNIGVAGDGGSGGAGGVNALIPFSIVDAGGVFAAAPTVASSRISAGVAGIANVSTAADAYGLFIEATNAGSGTAFGVRIVDGTQGAGKVLTSDATGRGVWATPASQTVLAAGSDKQIQFNDATARAGDADFTFDKSLKQLNLGFNVLINKERISATSGATSLLPAISAVGGKTDGDNVALSGTSSVANSSGDNIAGSFFASGSTSNNIALQTSGDVAFDDSKLGFFGATPVVKTALYTIANVTPDRDYDADSSNVDELADVLGTLVTDLKLMGLIT